MRLHDIILEDAYGAQPLELGVTFDEHDPEAYMQAVNGFVEEHCREWLRESRGYQVYRGIPAKYSVAPAFTRLVRTDRKPMNTLPETEKLHNLFLDSAGAVARRHNSAFVSGQASMAVGYGRLFITMPVGPFHYTWSPKMYDWWSMTRGHSLRNIMRLTVDLERVAEEIEAVISQRPTSGLLDTVADIVHYIVHGGSSRRRVQDVKENLVDALARIRERPHQWSQLMGELNRGGVNLYNTNLYDPRKCAQLVRVDRDLVQAIHSGHEIMIAAERMLYLNYKVFGDETV